MNFDLDDDQREFAAAARDFFSEQASPSDARRALDEGTAATPGRKALANIGFYGITIPESAGGAGQSVLDLAVVAEQGGRVLAGPSLVTAARVAVLLAGDDTRLAGLADGSVGYAVVDGSAPVLDAATANRFLARSGDDLVLAEGTVAVGDPIDPTRGLGTVTLGETEVIGHDVGARWEHAERVARVILAAEDLGAAARAVEMAVAYAKERAAFGRFIVPTRPSSTCWSTPTSGSSSCGRWCGGPRGRPRSPPTSSRWPRRQPRPRRPGYWRTPRRR